MNWNTIDACIQDKSLLKHAFYTAWSAGQLTLDDLRMYAQQYYALETTFPRLLSRIHSTCDNPGMRQAILANLNDEESGEMNHRELWLQFAEGVGCERDDVINAPLNPETSDCIRTLMELAAHPNPAIGLSMLYAYESQLPAISQSKIEGLKRFYGIDDPRALRFFDVHKEVDAWHSEQEKMMIDELNSDEAEVKDAAQRASGALWHFLDGVNAERLARNGMEAAVCCH
jgi:pyrroloquinoline-quinone synthase